MRGAISKVGHKKETSCSSIVSDDIVGVTCFVLRVPEAKGCIYKSLCFVVEGACVEYEDRVYRGNKQLLLELTMIVGRSRSQGESPPLSSQAAVCPGVGIVCDLWEV